MMIRELHRRAIDGTSERLAAHHLRTADAASLLPLALAAYAPRAVPATRHLDALSGLAVRRARADQLARRAPPRAHLRGLGYLACVTVLDSLRADAPSIVHPAAPADGPA